MSHIYAIAATPDWVIQGSGDVLATVLIQICCVLLGLALLFTVMCVVEWVVRKITGIK